MPFVINKIPKYSNYSILNLLNLIPLNIVNSKVNSKLVSGATLVFYTSYMIVSINVNIKLSLNILKLLFF